MEQSDPQEPSSREAPANGGFDALRRLEERLDRASTAAERLISEAAARASMPFADRREPPEPPPSGWQPPEQDRSPPRAASAELELLTALIQSLRDLIPPELRQRLAAALRELLLAIRALIDWYLDRLDRRATPVEVQDIPIA